MIGTRTVILLAVVTGLSLEVGIRALSGRREAWDSVEFWTLGLPAAGLVSLGIGALSRRRDWLWTVLIAPSQVTAMMLRSGDVGSLWPLAILLSSVLSAPFVAVAFVGSRFRRQPTQAP